MAEIAERKPYNPLQRIPLEILLLAERVTHAKIEGKPTPVPTNVWVPLGILAAAGVLTGGYFFGRPVYDYYTIPTLEDACNNPGRLMVSGSTALLNNFLATFEPPSASAAPLIGGGVLDATNRIGIDHKIALYNDTALPISAPTNLVRDALNHESLGMDIPPGVNTIIVFYQSAAETPELRRVYFNSMIPRITTEVERYRMSLGAPWSPQERSIIGGVELTTLFGETLLHPDLRLPEEFRHQFSRRVALGVRQAAVDGLKDARMYGGNTPPILSRVAQERLFQSISVYSLNSEFIPRACEFVRARSSLLR